MRVHYLPRETVDVVGKEQLLFPWKKCVGNTDDYVNNDLYLETFSIQQLFFIPCNFHGKKQQKNITSGVSFIDVKGNIFLLIKRSLLTWDYLYYL